MQIPYAVLFAVLFSIPTLAAPVAMTPGDELILAARKAKAVAKKPVVKAKPVAKKPAAKPAAKPKAAPKPAPKPVAKKPVAKKPVAVKPAPKPVAKKPVAKKPVAKKPVAVKPAPKPVAKKPVAVKKPVAKKPVTVKPVAKKPVAASAKKPAAAPAKKPVAVKPVAKKPTATPAKKPTTAAPAKKPVVACPLPAKKPAVRRFLEFIGLAERSDPPASCPPLDPADAKAASKAAKAKAKADKAAAAKAKADAKAKAAADAEAAKRKVGPVANAPTKAVQCNNKDGTLTEIPLAAIKTAVKLAQQGPLVGGKNPVKFPHVFNNREAVKVDSACAGKVLEEQAVGPDMSTFQNIPSVLGNFNQFRVVITTPDATTGATTFCGVMTHGTSTTGTFEKDLCAEV